MVRSFYGKLMNISCN